MEGVTLRTPPEPFIERKGLENMPTMGTAFRTGVPLVNLDQGAPIPLRFVLQLAHELAPAHIRDGLGEAVILEHVLDRETLDADHLVLVNDASREFVLIIPSPICYLGMVTRDLETCLGSVLASLFLLGKSSARRSEEHTSELQSPCNLVCRLL